MGSPLGKYAQVVAAGVSIVAVGTALLSRPLAFADPFIDNIALICVGAIFGSFATVNGLKQPVEAAHVRLDALGAPPAKEAEAIVHNQTVEGGPFTPTRPNA